MNFAFLMAGTISSNPWDILLAIFIAVAGYNAGKFGLDRFIIPIIGEKMARNKKKKLFNLLKLHNKLFTYLILGDYSLV